MANNGVVRAYIYGRPPRESVSSSLGIPLNYRGVEGDALSGVEKKFNESSGVVNFGKRRFIILTRDDKKLSLGTSLHLADGVFVEHFYPVGSVSEMEDTFHAWIFRGSDQKGVDSLVEKLGLPKY